MLKLSKVLVLSLLVVCLASAAFATTSRVQALAGTSNYINDDSNIFRWYGTLPSYANLVMAEAGNGTSQGGDSAVNADDQALGFTYSWGEDSPLGTWGIFLLTNSLDDGSFFAFNPLITLGVLAGGGAAGFTGLVETPTTKFVLAWGNELEQFSYGINFTRSDAEFENTDPLAPPELETLSFTTFGGGVRADLGENAYLDVAVTYGKAGGETTPAGLDVFDTSTAFDIAGRIFFEWRDDITMVPFVGFQTFEYSPNLPVPPATSTGIQGTDFTLGISFNMDVNTSNMLIFATEFESATVEPANVVAGDLSKADATVLPKFFLAVESDINSWLTTRVGATKTMVKIEVTDVLGNTTTETGNPLRINPVTEFEWFLGAGFHMGDWDVDAVLANDTPFRLGYWLTGFGTDDPDPPIKRISATYRF
ncbi:MAG: hypothetical protein V3V49_12715 [Candidatus Krumholzibacteria bacterium]